MLRTVRAGTRSAGPEWLQAFRCLILAFGVASALAHPHVADAMTPRRTDWFGEIVSVEPAGLPSGVAIVQLPAEPNGDTGLEIRNSSDTPLYLLSDLAKYRYTWGKGPLPPDPAEHRLPTGMVADRKAQSGRAFT
jgi:hypothetical protein